MKRIGKENNFLIIWFCFVFLLLGICNIGFVKSTLAGFGGMTGQLIAKFSVEYFSNFPNELGLSEKYRTDIVQSTDYVISENTFILDGYEFVNWNTSIDGTGDVYESGEEITLDGSLILYAQWKRVDVVLVSYGDVDLNGVINNNDYLLIEQSFSSNSLTGQSLMNADVNADGKIDLVDVDIIKQVCLGTEGYVGMLPKKPILVYEIYNDNVADEEENNNESSSENNNGNQPSHDMSGNNGSSSNGNGTSGNGNGSSSNGTGSSNNSSNENKPSSDGTSENNKDESDDVVVNDKEENKDDEFVIEKEDVDENDSNDNVDNNGKNIYPLIIVFCICLIAFRLIVYIIKRFNEKNDFDKENFK